MSPLIQTSNVEGYHSLIIQFAPKNVVFSFKGMLARLFLAGLHYNYNSGRNQGRTADGTLQHVIRHPKFKKGGYTVVNVKEKPTFEYASDLMDLLFTKVVNGAEEYQARWDEIEAPPPLNSMYHHPEKSVAIQAHTSRYNALSKKSK